MEWAKEWAREWARKVARDVAGFFVALLLWLLFVLYFVEHQASATGFFTPEFGPLEAFLFYVPGIFGFVVMAGKIVVGRRNVVRPYDILYRGFAAVAAVWLLLVFPFDFSHLADLLPDFLRFLLQWVSDDVARVLMAILIIGNPIGMVYDAALYVSVRRELSKP